MSISRKYRRYGTRRDRNLADLENKELSLTNLLNNLSGPGTFESSDLNCIREIRNTSIFPETFFQLAGTAPRFTTVDEETGTDDQVVRPIIRIEDTLRSYRDITGDPSPLMSKLGPKGYIIPSNLIPVANAGLLDITDTFLNLSNPSIIRDDDFWTYGEFIILDKFDLTFTDNKGGVFWEGFFSPNPNDSDYTFNLETNGLIHIEWRRDANSSWTSLVSVYSDEIQVDILSSTPNTITVSAEQIKSLAIGQTLVESNNTISIASISDNTATLTDNFTFSGSTATFAIELGNQTYTKPFNLGTLGLDRGDSIEFRFFWWYPEGSYEIGPKYCRFSYSSRFFDYYYLSAVEPSVLREEFEILKFLDDAVTPAQEVFSDSTEVNDLKSLVQFSSTYEPKNSFSDIRTAGPTNITFYPNEVYVTGTASVLADTEIGNYIIPNDPTLIGSIKKYTRIKDSFSEIRANSKRLITESFDGMSPTTVSVNFLDHNGLVDYVVASSSGSTVTISSGDIEKLRKGMICITSTTNSFVTITNVTSNTTFETSDSLGITNQYIYIYSNTGILDQSKETLCAGVFGRVLQETVSSGTTLKIDSEEDIIPNVTTIHYFPQIPSNTVVTNVSGTGANTVITISNAVIDTINVGSTIVFAYAGAPADVESCVLPLDLSPPFVGIDTGLQTDRGIRSSLVNPFDISVKNLNIENATVTTSTPLSNVNSLVKISIDSIPYKILAQKI